MGPLIDTGAADDAATILCVFPLLPRVKPVMDGAQVMLPVVRELPVKLVPNGWMVT